MIEEVRTRIAPSPTGFLHIGTARTALFNYLFARQQKGKFLLRIEDTDFSRNNQDSYNSILNGLKFLELGWDEEVIYQSRRIEHHKQAAQQLLENGKAYFCYLSLEEINRRKEEALNRKMRYLHKHSPEDEIPRQSIKPVIRIKSPCDKAIINKDLIQGEVIINSDTIEDFVIVRADGTPVYMLSVVCDDIDMNITHVIRGDDHLTNTPKQILIYEGLGAKKPLFGHIPLIHGTDGKKLSKRHGALAVEEYKEMGYLPQSLRSYLIRLGWGSENNDILDDKQMLKEFSLQGINSSPSCFSFEKLNNINHHFITSVPEEEIYNSIVKGRTFNHTARIQRAVSKIRYRYNTLSSMQNDFILFEDSFVVTPEAMNTIKQGFEYLQTSLNFFQMTNDIENLENKFKEYLKAKNISFSKVGPPLRGALIGVLSSIGIFEIIYILGIEESISRIEKALKASV